jgi:hypothetical protein
MVDGSRPNGLREQVRQHEYRLERIEGSIEKIREQFPNRDRCDDHARQIRDIDTRVLAVEDGRIAPDEWKEVKADVMNLRLKTGWMVVVLSAVIIVANMIAAAFVKSAVERAFARSASTAEERR